MIVAVTYENGEVFQHYGHCKYFKIYEVSGDTVTDSAVVTALASGHGEMASFLQDYNTDALICGGIGGEALEALADARIRVYPGVTGNADSCVTELLNGSLSFDSGAKCNHNHEEGHSCGEHGCCCGGDHGSACNC